MECQHNNVTVKAKVYNLTSITDKTSPKQLSLEIEVSCECGKQFKFPGLRSFASHDRPYTNADETKLITPIKAV